MQPLIVVPANDIDTSGVAVEIDLPIGWLGHQLGDADATPAREGRFLGRLSRSGKADIVVRGSVKAMIQVPCARCTGPTELSVHAEIALLLKPKSATDPHAKAYEFTSDEADLDEYDGERVVLDAFVREAILLEVPSFPLCSEACPGIAPSPDAPTEEARPAQNGGLAKPSPFEALRQFMTGEGGDPAKRPSPADLRRARRAKSRAKPKIRSSIVGRTKK